jgi:enamine deaminase RidA (YjgF/YER057c/UK114 family)
MATSRKAEPGPKSSSAAPWEAQVGGCRALRIGAHVWITGATALRADGRVFGRGDAERQASRCLDVIDKTLEKVGANASCVVRTRVFLVDIAKATAVERVIRNRFGRPPAGSIVEVSALRNPAMLVEIEAEAYVPETGARA